MLLQETLFTSKGLFVLYLVILCLAWVVMTCFVEEVPLPPNSDNSYAVASDGLVNPRHSLLLTVVQELYGSQP